MDSPSQPTTTLSRVSFTFRCLREFVLLILLRHCLNVALDPDEHGRLPLVQLVHLVIRVQPVGEVVRAAVVDGLHQVEQ